MVELSGVLRSLIHLLTLCVQVMIVNMNPYDTGFDENAHVMRFSAVAREIQTTASSKVGGLRRQINSQLSAFRQAVSGPMKIKVVVPVLSKIEETATSSAPRDSQDYVMVEEEIEVVEEDDSDEEDERDLLVEHLFEQLREMKMKVSSSLSEAGFEGLTDTKLFESEMRNASIEVEVRDEVAREMQETVQKMHVDFTQRFQDQVRPSTSL